MEQTDETRKAYMSQLLHAPFRFFASEAREREEGWSWPDVVVSVWQSTSVISAPRKISPLHPLVDPKGDDDSNFGWCGRVKLGGARPRTPEQRAKGLGVCEIKLAQKVLEIDSAVSTAAVLQIASIIPPSLVIAAQSSAAACCSAAAGLLRANS
jgi:hypothetical protein